MTSMWRDLDEKTDFAAADPDLSAPPIAADQMRQLAERAVKARDTSPTLRHLKHQTERLPIGHPSSPWNEDGSPRPASSSLKDVERLVPPLTDAPWADHLEGATNRLEQALSAGLSTELLHTIDRKHQIWTPERNRLHASIIEDIYRKASDVPGERLAVMAGGVLGAGKTTVLGQHQDIDRSKYLRIDPDDFKEELARRGMVPEIPGLSPMEASVLAHKESSHLARRLALRAAADGKNVIWDISMSSTQTTSRRIDELRGADYKRLDAIFVDSPTETCVARADARHRLDHDRYLAEQGLGGRGVLPDVIRSRADPEFGSVNRRVFETVKDRFDHWAVYDNSVDGRNPVLIESGHNRHAMAAIGPDEASRS